MNISCSRCTIVSIEYLREDNNGYCWTRKRQRFHRHHGSDVQWEGNVQRSSSNGQSHSTHDAHWTASQHSFSRSNVPLRKMLGESAEIRGNTPRSKLLQQSAMWNHTENEAHRRWMDDGGKWSHFFYFNHLVSVIWVFDLAIFSCPNPLTSHIMQSSRISQYLFHLFATKLCVVFISVFLFFNAYVDTLAHCYWQRQNFFFSSATSILSIPPPFDIRIWFNTSARKYAWYLLNVSSCATVCRTHTQRIAHFELTTIWHSTEQEFGLHSPWHLCMWMWKRQPKSPKKECLIHFHRRRLFANENNVNTISSFKFRLFLLLVFQVNLFRMIQGKFHVFVYLIELQYAQYSCTPSMNA